MQKQRYIYIYAKTDIYILKLKCTQFSQQTFIFFSSFDKKQPTWY